MDRNAKIFVAGHRGLVGSAILRHLKSSGYTNIITRASDELDLTDQKTVEGFFKKERPEYVYLAAAKVGGILANSTYPAEFLYENIMIGANVVHASYKYGVKKLLNLGSSCIYPRLAPQPIKEDSLLISSLEPTNEGYAIAKISTIKLCRYYNQQYGTNFISVMPTNQYGPCDNFNMETAHLLPMIMRRFYLAKLLQNNDWNGIKKDIAKNKLGYGLDEIVREDNLEEILNKVGAYRDKALVWGDGSVYRELMHSYDLANACVYIMENYNYSDIGELINITGETDILLSDLFVLIQKTVGFAGRIEYDTTKPNGMPRKLMDATKIQSLGWKPKISLRDGLEMVYEEYK